MVVPGCEGVESVLPSTPPPYYTSRLPLSRFLQPELLARYFLSSQTSQASQTSPIALSLGTRIDLDDVFALTPQGE